MSFGASGDGRLSLVPPVMIFIDGNYFERRIKEKIDADINYSELASDLMAHVGVGSRVFKRAYYYDGLPNPEQNLSFLEEAEQTQRKNELQYHYQTKKDHFDKIAMLESFEVRRGNAVYNKIFDKQGKEKWDFRQKGVDSLIAIDMLTKAYQGQYDLGILVAGDSDYVEIVKSVKNSGVRIMGAYFETNMPKELLHEFDRYHPLRIDELKLRNILKEK